MTHRTAFARIAAAGTLVAALALSACSSPAPADDASAGDLHLGLVTLPGSFAPWEAGWGNDSPLLQAVYDTLLRAEPDGSIAKGLVTEWAWDDSKTVLTLTLRDDVQFSDGQKLTAQVAADYLVRFRDGTSANASNLAGMTSAVASDKTTLVVTLSAPDPAFLVYLTQNAGLVGSPAMFDSTDAKTTPIGSGPYVLDTKDTVVGSTYVYEAKDDYWDPNSVHYKTLEMTVYSDPTALMNAVKGGQVDASNLSSPTQMADAKAAGYTAQTTEQSWTGYILADREGKINPALGDVRVRQAINYALDRQGLTEALNDGLGTVTTQVFSKDSTAFDKALDERYPYDPEKATDLLAEAGYPDGFTLVMPSNSFVPEAVFAVNKEALAAVGINVEWQQTGDDLFGRMLGGEWAAFSFVLQSGTSWQTIQQLMLPESTWNTAHVADPKVIELADVVRTGSEEDAAVAAKQLNQYIVDQAWFAPISRPYGVFITADGTTAVLQTDNAVPYLWNIKPSE